MDIRQLMEEANAKTVAEFLGMRIVKRGKYDFIQCPGHEQRLGKSDHRIGNAVLSKNGYKCFACNTFVPTINMVMEYTDCDKKEAYRMIANAMGGEDLFPDTVRDSELPQLRLTAEELEVLKLHSPFPSVITERMTSTGKIPVKDGLYELYKADKNSYYQVIRNRAKEMIEKYQRIREQYVKPDSPNAYRVYDLLGPVFDRSVYRQVTIELDRRIEICKRIISILPE